MARLRVSVRGMAVRLVYDGALNRPSIDDPEAAWRRRAMATAVQVRDYKLLIDGQMVDAASGETFETVSPAHNEVIGRVAKEGKEDVDRAAAAGRKRLQQVSWSS